MNIISSPFNIISIIRKKRDGVSLTQEEIEFFVSSYTQNQIPDYQAAALLMAMFLRGISSEELLALTKAMLYSGNIVNLSHLSKPKIDKHSTGGVGDLISLPLAPAVAACGVFVPMLSGRGLGHTGGTLDKLESIPGFHTNLSIDRFIQVLEQTGLCLIGQTEDLAPADKKIYALRDATGTVESIQLIASSIMSKKLAEGIDGIVFDVKVGSGAFMKTLPEAKELAHTLISLSKGAGKKASAFITNMDQPLGRWIGNAVEVNESIRILRGKGDPELCELTCQLGGEMLLLAGVVSTPEEGQARISEVLANGKALQCFHDCAQAQGATISLATEKIEWMETNFYQKAMPVLAPFTGYVSKINAETVGFAGVPIKSGRSNKEEHIDPSAFIYLDRKVGEFVQKGEPLCHFAGAPYLPEKALETTRKMLLTAYEISETKPTLQPFIFEVLR